MGPVLRLQDLVLEAINAAYGRQPNELKALEAWRDAAIFNRSARNEKGQGKGKGENGGVPDVPEFEEEDAEAKEELYIFQAKIVTRIATQLHGQLRGKVLLSHYNEWCSRDRPSIRSVAWRDVCIGYDQGDSKHFDQLDPTARKNTYISIPTDFITYPLDDPVFQHAFKRVKVFIRSTFWANSAAWNCHQAALAIAKRGLNIDEVFFYWGPGGVGLTLTTELLEAQLGPDKVGPDWEPASRPAGKNVPDTTFT